MQGENRPLVDVHGSCVSYTIVKDKTLEGENRESSVLKNHYFFSHVNHWGLMTEPFPLMPAETDFGEALTPHMVRIITQNFDKSVREKLKESKATWLMLDFYDSARIQWFYSGGWFTHCMDLNEGAPEFWKKAKDYITGCSKLDFSKDGGLWEYIDKYMNMVIEKYGVEHIILNRVMLSKYIITDKKELVQFEEEVESVGCWRDNARVRAIEEYVLQKYPIAFVDISKYFVADWELDHDYFPVHYEREYYECADRAIAKIVAGKVRYVDEIDELAFAYKLEKDMTTPEGKDNWKNYILAANTSFSVNSLMDELIAGFSLDELHQYRYEIAKTYKYLYDNSAFFKEESISKLEKQERLIACFEGASKL